MFRVAEIVIGQRADLPLPLRGVYGRGGALDGVGHAVRLGRVAAVPQRVQALGLPGVVGRHERFGHHGEGAAGAGEPRGLGKTPELHRDLARPLDLVYGMRDLRVADEGLVGGVEEDQRLVPVRVGHPFRQLAPRGGRARGVVRKAEVDDVHALGGQVRHVVVFPGRGKVDQPLVAAVDEPPGTPGHDVGVDVHGVDRVGDRDPHVGRQQFLEISRVALGAVADEDLVGRNLGPEGLVVVPGDRLAQEIVPLLGAVPAEMLLGPHFVDGLVKGRDTGGGERPGDVPDAEPDDLLPGVPVFVFRDPPGDIGKQVGGLQFSVVLVEPDHRLFVPLRHTASTSRPRRTPGRVDHKVFSGDESNQINLRLTPPRSPLL